MYFATDGLHLLSAQNDHQLATLASDARIAFHVIQTGGVQGQSGPSFGPRGMDQPASDARAAGRTWAEMTAARRRLLHVGSLELAFFCTDRREQLVGEFWQTMDPKLKPDTRARIQSEGLRHEVTFPTSEFPARCKVVAYDYVEGRLGSVVVKLR